MLDCTGGGGDGKADLPGSIEDMLNDPRFYD